MKRSYHYFLLVLGLVLNPLLFGQVVNTGMLYVSPETELSSLEDFSNLESAQFYNDGIAMFYADFLNDGEVDHYLDQGQVQFIGSATQLLSGTGQSYFWNLLFSNSSSDVPFHLYSDLTADGRVRFKDGIIDSDSFGGSFFFGKEASHSGASDNSHVDGAVAKLGESAFEFPIGDKGYHRAAGLSGPVSSAEAYIARYYLENPGVDYPLDSKAGIIRTINPAEYWEILPMAGRSELVLTLSWNELTTPSSLLQAPQGLHIVRWDEDQQLWVDEGGSVDLDNRSVSAVVSDFGIFTLGSVETGAVLPCQLAVYNAITPNNDGKNDHFIIDQLNNVGCTDKISVKIFNRWNTKVFETDDYGKSGKVFDGYSAAAGTLGGEKLPTGTYFYILEFDYSDGDGNTKRFNQQGYLYLNGN